jgi:hypothetical protein
VATLRSSTTPLRRELCILHADTVPSRSPTAHYYRSKMFPAPSASSWLCTRDDHEGDGPLQRTTCRFFLSELVACFNTDIERGGKRRKEEERKQIGHKSQPIL